MTDEVNPISPPEPAPTTQPVPVVATPASESIAPESIPPAVSAEVANQISEFITEAVQDTLVPREKIEVAPLESSAGQLGAASPVPVPKVSASAHMRAVVQSRKQARLEKIMEMANQKRVIVNGDVQELIGVSDPTATRYLEELVKNGRLKRSGVRRAARYEPMIGSNSAT